MYRYPDWYPDILQSSHPSVALQLLIMIVPCTCPSVHALSSLNSPIYIEESGTTWVRPPSQQKGVENV